MPMLIWYWIDTRWGCGGIAADAAGVIRDSAPIFGRLRGQILQDLVARGRYRLKRLTGG